MPRQDDDCLERFVRAIENGDRFSLGSPWLSDGGALVLPILTSVSRPRSYVLADEVPEACPAEDPGRIDRLRVWNRTRSRVFVRPGTLFQSNRTASRGTTVGVLVEPQGGAQVDVRCVHASQAIAAGATLEVSSEPVPEIVYGALLSGNQGSVWASVERVVHVAVGDAIDGEAHPSRPHRTDDLVAVLSGSPSAGNAVPGSLRAIPSHENQCGALLLDEAGVVAVEMFDSPTSWRVVARAMLQRHVDRFRTAGPSPLKATVDAETAIRLAKDFLEELARTGIRQVGSNGGTFRRPLGGFTAIDGEIIHLVAVRPDVPGHADPSAPSARSPAELDEPGWPISFTAGPQAGGAEVLAVGPGAVDFTDPAEPAPPVRRARRRKILSSGWAPAAFQSLEHYASKEFGGDRSAAMRFLVEHGLRRRGYLRPPGPSESGLGPPTSEADNAIPEAEARRVRMEARIHDFERVALTTEYPEWLRERARREIERVESSTEDEAVRVAARSALTRLGPIPAPAELREPAEIEAPPPVVPPVDVRDLLRRAIVASGAGDYPSALSRFDEALEADPANTTALLGRAVALRRSGKPQAALAGLDLVLGLQPNNAAALLNRGRILQERGDLAGALETLDRLVAVAPDDWDVWMARGDLLLRMGRNDDAHRAYAEALRRNPEDERLQRRVRTLEKARTAQMPTGPLHNDMPRGVEEGQSYLVKEKRPELSYRMFRAMAGQGVPSLLITRQPPERVRTDPGLAGVRVLRLSHAPGEETCDPTDLARLKGTIERFVEQNEGRGAILLDGFDLLLTSNGFRDSILFIEHVYEFILQRRAVLLLPVDPDAIPEKESALLERNLKVVS